MSQPKEQISILIEYTVAAENMKPDLEACLEIADRVNSGKSDCIEAMATIQKLLVHKSPQLLETLCKNCNMLFLRELNNKKMVDAMMKLLVKRRDRAKYGKIAPSTKNDNKVQIEDKALYLIQLWADTFMMHQEEYKNIHDAYRVLRKEGVKFPDRDPTMKYMINFQGTISPVFLAMEGNYIVPSNNQGGAPMDPKKSYIDKPKVVEPEYKHTADKNSYNNYQQNTLYDEEGDDDDDEGMDAVEITKEEVKIIEESINILNEIKVNGTKPGDLKSEIAREILADLVHVRKRINKLILTDQFSTNNQRNQAMLLNDNINSNLESYKNRYAQLKHEYKLGIKSEPLVEQPKKSEEKQKGADDAKEQQESDAKKDFNADLKKRFTKLAPPTGWKGTKKQEVVDLLDDNLLSDPKEEQKNDNSQKVEKPKVEKGGDLLDNLLNLQIGTNTNTTNQQTNNNQIPLINQGNHHQQQQQQQQILFPNNLQQNNVQQSQQVNTDLTKLYNQPQIQTGIIPVINPFGGFQQPQNNNMAQSSYLTSSNLYNNQQQQPNLFGQQPVIQPNLFAPNNQFVQPQNNLNTNPVFTQPIISNDQKKKDDDDFFSDLANKK